MRTLTSQIILTKLRGYILTITILPPVAPPDGDGKPHAQATECYVVTDEGYTIVPEGQKNQVIALTVTQQTGLDNLMRSLIKAAYTREEVDPEVVV